MTSEHSHETVALIVDDEPDICFLLSNILKQRNIFADCVGSITQAEKLLQKRIGQPFLLVFLDNHLPDGHGVMLISKIRTRFPDTRITMITAHDNSTDRELANQGGVDYFISKPFSKDQIFQILDAIQVVGHST